MSSDDLTKLSGPELADHVGNATNVSDSYVQMVGKEAARRLRELDQRDERIEALSAQVRAADKRAIAAERALVARTVAAVGGRVSELERELERWREWKDGIGCVPVAADDDTAMAAIGDRCATLRRIEVILGVEDSDEEGAGYEALRKVVSERGHWKSKAIGTQAQIDRDDRIAQGMSTAELVAELKRMRETRIVAVNALNETKAKCANQRKELHTLNVERKATLTKLEEAQLELSVANERMERLRLRGIEEDDSYDPYKRLCDIVDEECGLQPAKLPTGTMLSMIENALFEWRKRCGELAEERKPHEGQETARVKALVDTLRNRIAELENGQRSTEHHQFSGDTSVAGIDAHGCYHVAIDSTHHDAYPSYVLSVAAAAIAELEARLRAAQTLPRKSYHVALDLTPDCAPIAESPFPAAVAVAHAWGAGKGTTPLSEPAERKPHEGRVYAAGCGPDYDGETLDDIISNPSDWSHVTYELALHLRELLGERKGIEARAIMEVLNGKR